MLKILRSKSYKPRYIVLTYKHFHFYFRILQRRLHTIVTILSANFVKFNSTYSSFHPTKVIEVRVIGGHTVYIYYLANFTAITFIIFIFFFGFNNSWQLSNKEVPVLGFVSDTLSDTISARFVFFFIS